MHKVKIFELFNGYSSQDDEIYQRLVKDETEWLEVTDEELSALEFYTSNSNQYPYQLVLVREPKPEKARLLISDYLEKALEFKRKKDKREEVYKAKQEKIAAKKQKTMAEREKKLLEKLKSKYEG